jgi:Kef-type K+ transport system membrane component KefB
VNDVLSWVALAVALLAQDGHSGLALVKLVGAAIGLVAALALLAYVADRRRIPNRPWSVLAIPAGLAGAAFTTSAMGLHYIFGAFAFGLVAARASLAQLAAWPVRACSVVATILLPLYLVLPGATIDFRQLDLHAGGEVLLVIGVAAAAKVTAGALSARAIGFTWNEAMSVGVLLDTRGLVELVALAIGRSAGILDTRLYAVLVIMAVVTTVATSPALRLLERAR